jgi:hypothetical protein
MEFNKEDVEKFYKFLNHAKFTEVRIIDPRIGIKEVAFVDNLNDFLAVCERYNGQANVYVSVNERSSKEGKAENVSALQIIPLDIDPVRPKGQASTDAELEVARQKMLEIKKWLKENFHCTPFTNMSGNGFHLFMKIPAVPLDQFNRPVIEEKLRIFVHGIQEKFNDEKVHIDSTFDLPRVMKCPGTMSVKGDNTQERPRRMCQIIDPTDVPSVGVLNHLVAIQKPEKAEGEFKLGDKGVKEFVELLEKDQKLRDLVMGDWKKYSFSSRSEAEQSLLTKLVAAGFSEQSINTIMMKSKIGKWKEKTDAYRHRSIEKAIEFVEEHKEAIEPVKYKQSCGEDLESKVCEQISNNEFIVYDKTSGQTTNERTVDEFKPYEKIIWKPVDKATDYKSEQELWSEVKRFIYEHMDVSEGYDVLTAWVLMSWVPERWKAVPYLFFFGPKGSGKSRALEILGAIGFRPFLTGSASLAAIFRLIQMWHVTLFLDETEIYMKKDYRDVQNLLNTGYRRGWPTVRVEEDREGERIPVQFDTFGPKALAGTKELLDTLKSRCVVFGMSKAIRDIRDEIDEEWAQSLREKLLMYRFSILTKKELPEKPKLFKGRLRELFDPLIIVAPLAEKNPIIQQAKKIEGDLKEEEEMSLDAIVFKAIMKVYQETQEEKLLISDISKIVNEKLEVDEMVTNITVGMTAKRLGFQKCLKGGARAIRWNKELAERLIMRYGGIESQKLLGPKRFRKGVTEWLDWGLNEAGR